MLLSAHICRQRYPSESTISILQHLMHQQLTTNRIKILSPFQKKTAREAYVFAKTTKNYLSVAIRLVSPETLSPQSILLKFSIPKTLSRSSTHTLMYVQWGHGGFGYQIALFFFFPPPPQLNGNFSYISFKPAKNILHEKLKQYISFERRHTIYYWWHLWRLKSCTFLH